MTFRRFAIAVPPAWVICSETATALSKFTSAATTTAPSLDSLRHVAAPIPPPAPVTRAIRRSSDDIRSLLQKHANSRLPPVTGEAETIVDGQLNLPAKSNR